MRDRISAGTEQTQRTSDDVHEAITHSVQRRQIPLAFVAGTVALGLIARHRITLHRARQREQELQALWDRMVDALHHRPRSIFGGDGDRAVAHLAHEARAGVEQAVGGVMLRAQALGDAAGARARQAIEAVEACSRQSPLTTVAVALAAGALLGAIARR